MLRKKGNTKYVGNEAYDLSHTFGLLTLSHPCGGQCDSTVFPAVAAHSIHLILLQQRAEYLCMCLVY